MLPGGPLTRAGTIDKFPSHSFPLSQALPGSTLTKPEDGASPGSSVTTSVVVDRGGEDVVDGVSAVEVLVVRLVVGPWVVSVAGIELVDATGAIEVAAGTGCVSSAPKELVDGFGAESAGGLLGVVPPHAPSTETATQAINDS